MSAPEPQPRDIEPKLVTAPELAGILKELSSREPIFHRPEHGTSRVDLEKMTVEDFWEMGASGRRYSREFVLDELERRRENPPVDIWKTTDFYCRRLAGDMYLLTYTLVQDNARLTRRATIWEKSADGWKVVYHQGTIVQEV